MAEIKSAAVLGAGAVGSYVIWGLSQKENIRLGVIADGERAERLKINQRLYLFLKQIILQLEEKVIQMTKVEHISRQ